MLIVRKVAQPVSHIETEQSLGHAVITIWVFLVTHIVQD